MVTAIRPREDRHMTSGLASGQATALPSAWHPLRHPCSRGASRASSNHRVDEESPGGEQAGGSAQCSLKRACRRDGVGQAAPGQSSDGACVLGMVPAIARLASASASSCWRRRRPPTGTHAESAGSYGSALIPAAVRNSRKPGRLRRQETDRRCAMTNTGWW